MSPRIVDRGSCDGRGEVELLEFSHPQGQLRAAVLRGEDDDAILDIRCERWAVRIVWYGEDDDCRCFEYRQFFMAPPIRVHPPDGPQREFYMPIRWEQHGDEWRVIQSYPSHEWVEDTQAILTEPGLVRRYGYRADDRRRSAGQFASDGYHPWLYQAIDEPHFAPQGMFPPGTRYLIDVAFKGQIVNVCDGGVVAETESWYWQFHGD